MGIAIDGEKLSELLGVPVLLTAAGRKQDLHKLLELLSAEPAKGSPVKKVQPCVVCAAEMIADQCIIKTENRQLWREKVDRILISRTWGVGILLDLLMFLIWLTVSGANIPSQLLEAMFHRGYVMLHNLLYWLPPWLQGIIIDGAYATSAQVISVMLPPMAILECQGERRLVGCHGVA